MKKTWAVRTSRSATDGEILAARILPAARDRTAADGTIRRLRRTWRSDDPSSWRVLALSLRFPVLFGAALVAGAVDAIAGGGGLITVPTLLGVGIPPGFVLGTNKLQSSFGSLTATVHYAKEGLVDTRRALPGVAATAAGAAIGAWSVQQIHADALARAIPVLLILIALYFLVSPTFGHLDRHARIAPTAGFIACGIGLGFYDGFFGPGVGAFWALALVTLLGMNLLRATAYTKAMNVTSNVVSLALFLAGGHVLIAEGLTMAVGQIVGARIGAGLATTRGVTFIRPMAVTVALALAAKLLWSAWT